MPSGEKAFHLSNIGVKNQSEAKAHCQSLGGILATIKTQEEMAFVLELGSILVILVPFKF